MYEETAWVLAWFEQRENVPGEAVDEKLQINYFSEGLLDSIGIMELIAEIEETFQIEFEQRHFEDRRFSTIGGLGELIGEVARSSASGPLGQGS